MNSQPPFPVAHSQGSPEADQKLAGMSNSTEQAEASDDDPPLETGSQVDQLLHSVIQLNPQEKLLFIRQLFSHLPPKQLQAVLELGQQTLSNRPSDKSKATLLQRETVLTLKKDYTYQERGLSEPTQYYVYLRRRKPKLDRYIGTLFYVPSGCALNYVSDAAGNLIFDPPHNIFQLTDAKDPAVTKVVRLVRLEPPPADYTFTKQQQDTPAIRLQVEFLDPTTLKTIAQQSLSFPSCMHEGGVLDRYRWDVAVIIPTLEDQSAPTATVEMLANRVLAQPLPTISGDPIDLIPTKPTQVLSLPVNKSATFYLQYPSDLEAVLERLRLWVNWSEKAMPQSKWAIAQTNEVYTLMNANFKRSILSVSTTDTTVTLHGSLAVTVKWFHDLSLAVSQSPNQRRYSFSQLKLAHNLFVDMSLPQTDSLQLLKKLFGIEFCKKPERIIE